jgi:transposase
LKSYYHGWRRGRDQSGPKVMLEDFQGIIQTDSYSVYHALFESHPISMCLCMAQASRKIVDAVKVKDDEKQANYVLDEIQKLYLLEEQLRAEICSWE